MMLLFLAGMISAEDFTDQLFEMQCRLDTCHNPDDSCSISYIQPRVDCDLRPRKAQKYLRAV